MSVDDRLALIGRLWDSLDDGDVPVTAAQREELERRLAEPEDERVGTVTWTELRAALFNHRRYNP